MTRPRQRPTIEACASYRLDAARLQIRPDQHRRGALNWSDGFALSIEIDTRPDSVARLLIAHESRDGRGETIEYSVTLACTFPPYGGRRYWLTCPRTGRRCRVLFLPSGGRHFLSRQSYGLRYECQAECSRDRVFRRARKLSDRLGGDPSQKPKWMRWRTYDRLAEQWQAAEAFADHLTAPLVARFLGIG